MTPEHQMTNYIVPSSKNHSPDLNCIQVTPFLEEKQLIIQFLFGTNGQGLAAKVMCEMEFLSSTAAVDKIPEITTSEVKK